MIGREIWRVPTVLLVALILLAACARSGETAAPPDWRTDWGVEEGFALGIDSEGYHLPTGIAFVPEPGTGAKDPLYFVTELGGTVRVVTNDRSVYTFSENLIPPRSDQQLLAEGGAVGICLEPRHGYLYVTLAAPDGKGNEENKIVRFQSEPGRFSMRPTSSTNLAPMFSTEKPGLGTHQIDGCQATDDLLYVGVGDGALPYESRRIGSTLGKIMRMTFDGEPVADNPFYENTDLKNPANYMWALGFRNPFGLKIVEGRLYVADNGNDIDRFLEVHRGEDYHWDGTDWSIGINAAAVFAPSIAPAQMDFLPSTASQFPKAFQDHFYVAGAAGQSGKRSGIVYLKYDAVKNKVIDVPNYLLRYRGSGFQEVVGLAFGPDGLYFAPIMPDAHGRSAILKITYDPSHPAPVKLGGNQDQGSLLFSKGCYGCHIVSGSGGTEGPSLDRGTLITDIQARLQSKSYLDMVQALDRSEEAPFVNFRSARQEVISLKGVEQVRAWMAYHIQEPRFDNPDSQMPNLGLSKADSQLIADYLIARVNVGKPNIVAQLLARLIPELHYRDLIFFFAGGLFAGFAAFGVLRLAVGKLRRGG